MSASAFTSPARSARQRCDSAPLACDSAARAAARLFAVMRSMTASLSARSSLPFKKARLVNSPGPA